MGLFNFKKKSATPETWSNTTTPPSVYSVAGSTFFLDFTNSLQAIFAYKRCSPLQWALMTRASALKNAKYEVLIQNNDTEGDYATTPEAQLLRVKLSTPNDYESFKTFRGKIDTYKSLFGWCLIYKESATIGLPAYRADKWHVLNPLDVQPRYKNPNLQYLDNEIIYFDAQAVGLGIIPASECLIIKSSAPDPLNRYLSRPEIEAVSEPIANIIAAYEARNSLIVNRGAMGMLSPKSNGDVVTPLLSDEIKNIRDEYYESYGVSRGKSPLYFASVGMNYDQITMNVKELGLFEEVKDDIERICDATMVSMNLLSNSKGSTFSNAEAAERALYSRYVIPTDEDFFNYMSTSEWMGLSDNIRIHAFYDHVDSMQEGEQEKSQAAKAKIDAYLPLLESNYITINEFIQLTELKIEERSENVEPTQQEDETEIIRE